MGYIMQEKLAKIDKLFIGIVTGSLLPIVGFLVSFPIKTRSSTVTFDQYVDLALTQNPEQMDILIFSLIPNLLLFYFTNFRWKLNNFTQGLVGATVVGLIALIFLTS
ncbi:MAG: hypothetical protein HUJ25_15480 [Crocinitomicaceae bacterium]|nr:hypothetical protein [Crocinitomicaceae bacterium]